MPALHAFTLKAAPLAADEIYLASAADTYAERRATISTLLTSQTLTSCTLAGCILTTPSLGVATATSINGLALTASTGTLTIANGKTLTASNTITLAGTDGTVMTFPSTNATLARTDAANTFAGTQTFGGAIAGAAITGTTLGLTSAVTAFNATAVPAGGTTGSGFKFSSTANFGVFFGSGVPTLSAAQGSIYLRTDGSSTSTRVYVNSNGSTTWVAITTAS